MLRSGRINYKEVFRLIMSDDFIENYEGHYLLNSMNGSLLEELEFDGELVKNF